MVHAPTFVAFTGVDNVGLLPAMQSLSRCFPIEWGVLVDDSRSGEALFPDKPARAALLAAGGLRFAAHVCGDQAGFIANEPSRATIDLTGFQRLQVNHGFSGSSPEQIENTVRFGRAQGLRSMLQCRDRFPNDSRLDWLYDTSFGTGKAPDHWPPLPVDGPFCGYSGGINSANVESILGTISPPPKAQYWIDIESGVRTDGWFDIDKCEAVCRAVFG